MRQDNPQILNVLELLLEEWAGNREMRQVIVSCFLTAYGLLASQAQVDELYSLFDGPEMWGEELLDSIDRHEAALEEGS